MGFGVRRIGTMVVWFALWPSLGWSACRDVQSCANVQASQPADAAAMTTVAAMRAQGQEAGPASAGARAAMQHGPMAAIGLSPSGEPSALLWAEAEVWRELDAVRRAAGLRGVVINPALQRAARSHAHYLHRRQIGGHWQLDESAQDFSGYGPRQRALQAGYSGYEVQEVVARLSSRVSAVQALIAGPYHRQPMLRDDLTDAGVAVVATPFGAQVVVVMLGQRGAGRLVPTVGAASSAARLTVFPVTSARATEADEAPTSFNTDVELPDLWVGRRTVGYPVSLQTQAGQALTVTRFELRQVSERGGQAGVERAVDRPVPARLRQASEDEHLPAGMAVLIPEQTLEPAARYQAEFVGLVDGQPVTRRWEFATRQRQGSWLWLSDAEMASGGRMRAVLEFRDLVGGDQATLCMPVDPALVSASAIAPHTFELQAGVCRHARCTVRVWAVQGRDCQSPPLAEADVAVVGAKP